MTPEDLARKIAVLIKDDPSIYAWRIVQPEAACSEHRLEIMLSPEEVIYVNITQDTYP